MPTVISRPTMYSSIIQWPNLAEHFRASARADFGLSTIEMPIVLPWQTGFYDYHAKYFDEQTEFLFDTIDNPALIAKIKTAALGCFNALGCRHFARVDFRLGDDGTAYALELNAIPGFTTRSDLPKAAAKTGLSMSDLCIKIIEAALENRKTEYHSRDPAKREPK